MAGFVRNEIQNSGTDQGMAAPQSRKDIPICDEILEDLQHEDQKSPNDQLRRQNSLLSESEGVLSPQIDADTVGAATTAEQRYQQRIKQQSHRQPHCPHAPSQSNPLQMHNSSIFMQSPQQTITQARKKSSKKSPVRQTESQPVVQSPENRRNVQDIAEFRRIFKKIRKKLGFTPEAVALDLYIMYYRYTLSREISEFENIGLTNENTWELKCLLERWLQDNDSQKLRIIKEMLQFSKVFKQKRLERGFSQEEAASAIVKLYGFGTNQSAIFNFEDFSMSLSYMYRLKPLLQRWLTDTDSPSTSSMHFSPPVTTSVTTSIVPVTHRSPKADCDSSATSIERQLDSARSDDTEQSTSQISPNAQLRPHHSTFSESERVLSPQIDADTVRAAAAAEQRYQQRFQQQSYRQQLRPQAPSQSNRQRMPNSLMFMQTPQQTITQIRKKSSKKMSPNAQLRPHHSTFFESERLPWAQAAAYIVAAAAAEQRYQQLIQQQSYRQQLRPQAPSQSNPLQMPNSSIFMQTPHQTITQARKKSSKKNPVHKTESQPVLQSPEERRNVQDIEEIRRIFKQIRRKLGLTTDAVALDLTKIYGRCTLFTEISEFEKADLSYENMWELKCLLERWVQDKYPEEMRNTKEMLQFSQVFKQKRLERGFWQKDVASAIGKLDGCCVNQVNISKFEDFNLSWSYMCRLKPVLQRWLKDTDSPSNSSMHFSSPVTTLVTTSMVPITHRSPKADCDSSATSIDGQLDSALSDDTQQTTSQVLANE